MKEIHVHGDLGIVEVLVQGIRSPQTLVDIDQDVLDICQQRGLSRVLSTVQGKVPRPSLAKLYTYVRSGLKAAPLTGIRHAIVTSVYRTMHMQFLEAVARDRQIQIRVMGQREKALVWLMQPHKTTAKNRDGSVPRKI